jgi:hypothetical protein
MYHFIGGIGGSIDGEFSVSAIFDQCGGIGWTGCTVCASGTTCNVLNPCESSPFN